MLRLLQTITDRFARKDPVEALAPLDPVSNKQLAMEEYRSGAVRVKSSPELLTIESTSRCNLRCVMCPHAVGWVNRPKHLEEEAVEKLVKFLPRASSVQLHGVGEPLASPAFWKLIKLLPAAEICESSINSNLTVLDDRRLEQLLSSNLRMINVSLDAATPETYRKIRGFDFEVVTRNIAKMIAAKKARGLTYPHIYINMTMMRSNIEEIVDFVRLAADLGADKIFVWHLTHWPPEQMARYVVEREGWVFDYKKEGLWNFPRLSNSLIREAEAEAARLGIELCLDQNNVVYFDEDQVRESV